MARAADVTGFASLIMCSEPEFNGEWKDVNYARYAFVLPAIIR
jgi:hypothetical protein